MSTLLVMICFCWALAMSVIELAMSAVVEVGEETRYQSSPNSWSVYLKPPTTGVEASAKALGAIVPPLSAMTSGMPGPTVAPPVPPTLWMVSSVVPVALPPLMTIWSDADPIPPSVAFMAILAPEPT